MKTFIFTRILSVEERFSVTMSDEMANPTVARSILMRQLNEDKLTDAVKLVDSKVVNVGRISKCS